MSNQRPNIREGRRVHVDPFPEAFWRALPSELDISTRETEVLRLLVRGYTDRRIASELRIAAPTVRSHTRSLCRKLKCADRVDVILTLFDRAADPDRFVPRDAPAKQRKSPC